MNLVNVKQTEVGSVGYVSKPTNTYFWLGSFGNLPIEDLRNIETILTKSETVKEAYDLILDKYKLLPLAIVNIKNDGNTEYILSPKTALNTGIITIYSDDESVSFGNINIEQGSEITLFQHNKQESSAKVMNHLDLPGITLVR